MLSVRPALVRVKNMRKNENNKADIEKILFLEIEFFDKYKYPK